MENIRKYVDYVWGDNFDEDTCYIIRNKCLDAITNKLLTLNENNQHAYCAIIIRYFWSYMIVDQDLSEAIDDVDNFMFFQDNDYSDTAELISFFCEVSDIFQCFEISLNAESIKLGYKKITPSNREELPNLHSKRKFKKGEVAKITEQTDVIRTLLRSSEVGYSSDVDLSKFISWLCGGASESVRQYGFSKNVGFQNEERLKEKFSMIGLEYERGKIKNKQDR